jgi:hypothetical protein
LSQDDAKKEEKAAAPAAAEEEAPSDPEAGAPAASAKAGTASQATLEAYIGAEMYSRRVYPEGCPSFQKLAIKLFRVDKNAQGGPRLRLVDSHYANNKEGFGYMLKNLK